MCGLFGWVLNNGIMDEAHRHTARRSLTTLGHRGPDNQGEWFDERTYMGHQRLSILDLSNAANQPFQDTEGRFILTFNGEIYNYIELREELKKAGEVFRTKSDTEVMLKALKIWGQDALNRFDGMFAAALHDRKTGVHLLMRDQLGQKPLYYHADSTGVIYASELRALITLPDRSWRLNRTAFWRYLANGYYAWDESPVVGIKKLLPGCCLEIKTGTASITRYWDSIPGQNQLSITGKEAADEFERLFDNSCKTAMRSDVPYGVFLSGGIDSSLVLSSCKKHDPDVKTFCVAMEEDDFDESSKAVAMNKHCNVKHSHTFMMDRNKIRDSLNSFFSHSDEPHGDPGFVNAHFLSSSCHSQITVALSGDGGDELFAGYAPFSGLWGVPWGKKIPRPLMQLLKASVDLLPAGDRYMGLQFKLIAYLYGFPATDATRFPLWLAALEPEKIKQLSPSAPTDFLTRFGGNNTIYESVKKVMEPVQNSTQVQQLQYYFQKFFLSEFVCMHTDRAAMSTGLEVRSPFLSLPLIEFANRLPDNLKLRNGQLKWLLKETGRRRGFPGPILSQKKQGFTFPVARWLKTALRDEMESLLDPRGWQNGLLDLDELARLKDDHLSGRKNNYRILFQLMAFKRWHQQYPQVSLE
jgi:asparagine synthase (glutamine-hydrolysing)